MHQTKEISSCQPTKVLSSLIDTPAEKKEEAATITNVT